MDHALVTHLHHWNAITPRIKVCVYAYIHAYGYLGGTGCLGWKSIPTLQLMAQPRPVQEQCSDGSLGIRWMLVVWKEGNVLFNDTLNTF